MAGKSNAAEAQCTVTNQVVCSRFSGFGRLFEPTLYCESPLDSPPRVSAAHLCLPRLHSCLPQRKVKLGLTIKVPMLHVLMEKLIVRCVRSVLPLFG